MLWMWAALLAVPGPDSVMVVASRADPGSMALAQRYAALPINSKLDLASKNLFEGFDMPAVLMLLGERELALANLERLVGNLGGTAEWAVVLPALDPIRCEERFVAVVKKLKTTDPHFAKVCGEKK